MTDDPEQIRAAARAVSALAARTRDESVRVAGGGTVRWRSLGADRCRERLDDRSREFSSRATDLDALALALMAHARHVEDHERTVAAVARVAGAAAPGLVRTAASVVTGGVL